MEIFRYILELGTDINIFDNDNNTALHLAARSVSVDILMLLVDKEMSVNFTNKYGNTPLHFSAELGDLEATKFRLKEVLL